MTAELEVDLTARDRSNALSVALRPQPIGLSAPEIKSGGESKPAEDRLGIRAMAWVHFLTREGPKAARVECMVTAYNSRAVQAYGMIGGMQWNAWLWASAVTRI